MSSGWRALTEEEADRWPKARLGGALLGVVAATGALTMVLCLALLLAAWTIARDGLAAFLIVLGAAGAGPHGFIPLLSLVSVLSLLIWGTATFCCSIARLRATPAISAVGAAIVLFTQIAAGVAIQWLIMARAGSAPTVMLAALAPLAPQWIGGFAATAGLIGYMIGGTRPNAYYRRRIAVAS